MATKIIITLLLTCLLGTWTSYAGLKAISRVSRKYQAVCYIVPAVVIVILIKVSLLYF